MGFKGKRLVLGKLGLDAHDNGLRIVSRWLVGAGYEVIYAGLYNSPQHIVRMAIEEHVDAIGISFLGGEHLYFTEKLTAALRREDMEGVKVVIGGVIPPDDVMKLNSMGVGVVFTPGTPKAEILSKIGALLS